MELSDVKGLSHGAEPAKGADALLRDIADIEYGCAQAEHHNSAVFMCRASPIKAEVTTGVSTNHSEIPNSSVTTGEADLLREIDEHTTDGGPRWYRSLPGRCRAMIESLARERDTQARDIECLRESNDVREAGWRRAESENASLRAKLAERDADAERYRYLESGEHHLIPYNGTYLRKYIDKLMGADKEWHARQSAQAAEGEFTTGSRPFGWQLVMAWLDGQCRCKPFAAFTDLECDACRCRAMIERLARERGLWLDRWSAA